MSGMVSASDCLLRTAADRWPDALAVLAPPTVALTFRALDQAVEALAQRWQQAGVAPGDPVTLLGTRDAAAIVALLAGLRIGAIVCPLNTRNPPALLRQQEHALLARWRAADEPSQTSHPSALPGLPLVVPAAATRAPRVPPVAHETTRPATLLFTSGSTAAPKIAAHSAANHISSARACVAVNALGVGDRWLLTLPLYHVGGLAVVFRCLAAGAAVVVPPVKGTLDAVVESQAITHLSLVPTQLQRALQDPMACGRLRQARVILLGGAPLPASLLQVAVGQGLALCPTYGLTEMASQVATVPATARGAERLLPPPPLPGVELRLSADGEIWVRGAMRFLGYWEAGRCSSPSRPADWYATGDLGMLQAGGGLVVTGRRDNLFISGGENIQPEEIESALLQLPGVAQALVVPVPDPEFGERPAAFVRMHTGPVETLTLRAELDRVLPRYKHPVWVRPWPVALDGAGGLKASRAQARVLAGEAEGRPA